MEDHRTSIVIGITTLFLLLMATVIFSRSETSMAISEGTELVFSGTIDRQTRSAAVLLTLRPDSETRRSGTYALAESLYEGEEIWTTEGWWRLSTRGSGIQKDYIVTLEGGGALDESFVLMTERTLIALDAAGKMREPPERYSLLQIDGPLLRD